MNVNSCIDETNMSSIIEIYTDELLFTSSGRQALKVCNKDIHYKLLCQCHVIKNFNLII